MVASGNGLGITPYHKPETKHMKIVNVTIRGFKGLKRKAFETLAEIQAAIEDKDIVKYMNAYLGAHPFNSAVEAGIVELAEKAGHKMLTEKSEKSGKDVIIESNAEFLKRVKFTPMVEQVQAIVDALPWPPEARERTAREDAFTKVAKDRVQKAIAGGKSLEDIAAKLADKGFEPADETEDAVIAALADHLRSDEL